MTTDTKATEYAEGLRALAAMIEARPELAEVIGYALRYGMSQPLASREQMATLMRAGVKAGAVVKKNFESDKWARAELHFGPVRLEGFIERDEVCERVPTGETVTKKVKDPAVLAAVPEIEVVEEVYEWKCRPLLAEEPNDSTELAEVAS